MSTNGIQYQSIFFGNSIIFAVFFSSSSVKDMLAHLATQLDGSDDRRNLVNVDRDDVLEGAAIAWASPRFNPLQKLSVRFIGENGIDDGGPSREFLRLAMTAIKDSPLMGGPDEAKLINLDVNGNVTHLICIYYDVILDNMYLFWGSSTFVENRDCLQTICRVLFCGIQNSTNHGLLILILMLLPTTYNTDRINVF